MPRHLFPVLKILLTMRMEKDFSRIIKSLPFVNRISTWILSKNIIYAVISFVAAWALYVNYYSIFFSWKEVILFITISLLLLFSFINGMASYRRTHFPVYEKLFSLAPKTDKEIFLLLILEELIWSAVQSGGFVITVIILLYFLLEINLLIYFFYGLTILLLMILFFISGNLILGRYQIFKIQKKIGLIRFIIYLLTSSIFVWIGFSIGNIVAFVIRNFRQNLTDYAQLQSDDFYNGLWRLSIDSFWATVHGFTADISKLHVYKLITGVQQADTVFPYILSSIFCIILIFIVSVKPPHLKKIHSIQNNFFHKDFLHYYIQFFNKLFNVDNNPIFKKEMITLNRSRWIVSPGVFSMILYTFESFFYIGIFISICINMEDPSMLIALILLFNMMIMIMHGYDVISSFPQIFFLSSEGENIELLRSSPTGILQLFKAKVRLLRMVLTLPLLICMIFSLFYLYTSSAFSIFSFVLVSTLLMLVYVISPIIQLYMAPYFSKFSFDNIQEVGSTFEEKEAHIKAQGFPRYLILIPAMLFSFLNIFYPFYEALPYIHLIYYFFFLITSIVFLLFSRKIIKRGLLKMERSRP